MRWRLRVTIFSLAIGCAAAALIYLGFAADTLEGRYDWQWLPNGLTPFDQIGVWLSFTLYISIFIAMVAACVDRWVCSKPVGRGVLTAAACVGLIAYVGVWLEMFRHILGRPIIEIQYMIIASMISGLAACWLIYRVFRVYRVLAVRCRWSFWCFPFVLAVFTCLALSWFLLYLLDWTVGLGWYLGFNNAWVADSMFIVVGVLGMLIHSWGVVVMACQNSEIGRWGLG